MKYWFVFISILGCTFSNAQSFKIKHNELFRCLIHNHTSDVSTYHRNLIQKFFKIDDSKEINNYPHYVVKSNGKLFIAVERTGRLYEISEINNDTVNITRVDSTHFYGYNGSAILFSSNDTLFSFGGNGFWRTNGHLRYFSYKNHEWEIAKTNIEIPTSNVLYFHDKRNNCLYFTMLPYLEASTGVKHEDCMFYRMNLTNKYISKLGQIPKRFYQLISDANYVGYDCISVENPEGLFVSFDSENQYLFRFDKNEVYKLQNQKITDYFYGSSKSFVPVFSFSKNNYIFSTRMFDTTFHLDSVKINLSDFAKEPYPLYENTEEEKYIIWGSFVALVIVLSLGSIIYLKSKQKRYQISTSAQPKIETHESDTLAFNPIELSLIEKMIDPKKIKIQFSVEEINSILGLGKKSLEIQKKIRTETLNRINHKFRVIFETEGDLIERVRSEEDRRFYKYFISEENAKKLKV